MDQARAEGLSDEEVVERVRGGETALYETLMRRYDKRIYRIVRTIVRDEAEAEDTMQEAYVRAYMHLDQFAGQAKFSTWLTKIAIYEALSRSRRRARIHDPEREGMEELKSSALDPEARALGREAQAFLEAAVDALPESYRSVFVMRQIEEMSTAETAECLDLTEETVKIRLHRARAMLRRELYARAGAASSKAFEFMGERCDRVAQSVLQRISG